MGYENSTHFQRSKHEGGASDIWKSMNMPKVPSTRHYAPTWETEKPYHWTEDAACVFLPDSMFVLAHGGSPIAEGLTGAELKDLNAANFEAATKVCDTRCPVKEQCLSSAEDIDFTETVRAGRIPTHFALTSHGRPRRMPAEVATRTDPSKPCENGHPLTDWVKRADSVNSWYCRACRGEAQGYSGPRQFNDPTKPCKNDHPLEKWRKRAGSKKAYYCQQCKHEARLKADGKLAS